MRLLSLLVLLPVLVRAGELNGVVLNGGQPVREAIVYLDAVATKVPGVAPAVLDVQGGRFLPRIQVAHSGGTIIFQNSDPALHVLRVESVSRTNSLTLLMRLAMPYAGFEKRYTLPVVREPMLLRAVGENGELQKTAWIAVMPHPWAAVTDSAGRFTFGALPRSRYRVCVWHERLGTSAREVKLSNGQPITVDLQSPAKP